MLLPTSPLARLGTFRAELHATFTRRAGALFELGDALLCAQGVPSLPHLSLEPVCRRGWGSVYAALAHGRIDPERLRDLLASHLPLLLLCIVIAVFAAQAAGIWLWRRRHARVAASQRERQPAAGPFRLRLALAMARRAPAGSRPVSRWCAR